MFIKKAGFLRFCDILDVLQYYPKLTVMGTILNPATYMLVNLKYLVII